MSPASVRPVTRFDPYSLTKAPGTDYLLSLVIADAARSLESEIIEAIRPRVREHVARAMEDLKPRIEAHMSPLERDLAITLTVQEVPK